MADAQVARLEAVAARLEAVAARMGAPAGGDSEAKVPPTVVAYDAFYASAVQPLADVAKKIKGVEAVGADIEVAFGRQRDVVWAAAKCKKPSQKDLMGFVDPIVKVVTKYQNPDNRAKEFPFLKSFGEMIQAMNWMFMPGPVAIISATKEAADFYMMKVLKMSKEVSEPDTSNYRAYVSGMKKLIDEFAAYVKAHFLTGIIWNVKGGDLKSFDPKAAEGSGAASGGAPPAPALPAGVPPPPGPPIAPPVSTSAAPAPAAPAGGGGMAAVFAEINRKRDAAAAGMKKVTSEMKTKNRKDDPPIPVKKAPAPKPAGKAFGASAAPKKPPSLTCKQGTWFCENYDNELVEVTGVAMKENVYIYNCEGCTIMVPDKVKSIQVDKCKKTRIVFTNVVSTLELINSQRVNVTIQEYCATVTIDKCSGIGISLTDASVKTPPVVFTSCVTELNISVPGKAADDDPIELAVAEQFVTELKDGRVITKAVEHSG